MIKESMAAQNRQCHAKKKNARYDETIARIVVEGVWFPPNFQRPLAAKLCVRPQTFFKVKERARGPLSPCQLWWGSDFTRRRGGQKR